MRHRLLGAKLVSILGPKVDECTLTWFGLLQKCARRKSEVFWGKGGNLRLKARLLSFSFGVSLGAHKRPVHRFMRKWTK